jgi:hypothetical protein
MSAQLPPKIVEIASREVGAEEVNGTNCGPQVNEYKAATNLPPKEPWPWCAAFVCWVVKKAMEATETRESATFKRPKTAGAWDFENWSLRQGNETQTKRNPGDDIRAGDIVIFKFSHIGIAVENASGSTVETVEGNTDADGSREGGGVFRKTRKLSQVKTRIRFAI